jgi:hypothetical protein
VFAVGRSLVIVQASLAPANTEVHGRHALTLVRLWPLGRRCWRV